ncbi:MAG TPA: helix-turn-helix transcriptional regulator [Thermomicrobiales bacterium]|nr:helix-turn-helix transcriptional regulator [Thermomicrobiales bacterium]
MTAKIQWDTTLTWEDLSPRQQDIMLCLARGCSNQEIADELGLKLSTVRNNIAAVYEMLGLTNRVQALLWVLSYEELAQEVLQTA